MRARPKQENYYTKDPESNENAMFLDRYVDDWGKWADEAEVSLNAGDYLIAKQKQEIKELKDELIYSFRNAGLNDYEIELEFKRIKQTLK